jgi:hypothetical protein
MRWLLVEGSVGLDLGLGADWTVLDLPFAFIERWQFISGSQIYMTFCVN